MTPEIPKEFTDKFIAVRDINLAAMLLSDDRVPRLTAREMRRYYESNDSKPLYYFRFQPTDRSNRIYREWRKVAEANGKGGFDSVAVTYRAFATADLLGQIIKQGNIAHRPSKSNHAAVWTVNTKVAATALALAADWILPKDRLRGLVYRDGDECGYLLNDANVVNAFAAPNEYVALHPDEVLSYVIAAFYQREALRDLVNQIPAQYIFRKPETDEVYLVVEPNRTPKEIPVHA